MLAVVGDFGSAWESLGGGFWYSGCFPLGLCGKLPGMCLCLSSSRSGKWCRIPFSLNRVASVLRTLGSNWLVTSAWISPASRSASSLSFICSTSGVGSNSGRFFFLR